MNKKMVSIIFVFLLFSCSAEISNKINKKTEFSQNEIASNDLIEVRVTDSFYTFGDSSFLLDDGYLYVGVNISIKNVSDDKQSVSTFNWKLQNNKGTEVDASWNSTLGGNSFSGELLPDGEIEGTLFYEQPIDNGGLELVFYDSIFSEEPSFKFILDCKCNVPGLEKEEFSTSEQVVYRDVEYVVLGTQFSKGAGYTTPQTGNIFLGITLKTKNLSSENVSISSSNWKIIDSNGVQYDTTYYNPFNSKDFPSTTLTSNGDVSGIMVFEVPNSLTYRLAFYPDYFSDNYKFSFVLN